MTAEGDALTITLEAICDSFSYTICRKIGGTANVRLVKATEEQYKMLLDLS